MPIMVLDEISDWIENMSYNIAAEAEEVLDKVAEYYYDDIQAAFDSQGPGWKPLSDITKKIKEKRGAPHPERILHEWNTMRNSIEIRGENKMKVMIRKTRTVKFFYDPTKYLGGEDVTFVDALGGSVHEEFWRSVGLFGDTYTATSVGKPHKVVKADKPYRVVNRGIMHEFGGFEVHEIGTPKTEEIVTGRMRKKALKGESEAADRDSEIRTRSTKGDKGLSKPIYIPSRSFMRMPFDRSSHAMMFIFIYELGRLMDDA